MIYDGLLLIDLDGTLVDSLEITSTSYLHALEDIGVRLEKEVLLRELFGLSFSDFCDTLMIPYHSRADLRSRKNHYFSQMHSQIPYREEVLNEINSNEFSNHFKCLATHASLATVSLYVRSLFLRIGEYAILTSDNYKYRKSQTDYFKTVTKLFGYSLSQITLIDDNLLNIQTAKRLGCDVRYFPIR